MFGDRKTMMRIVLGLVVGAIAVSMLLYLVPQGTSTGGSPDAVAEVGDQTVTVADVRAELRKMEQRSQVPHTLEPLYAQQILQELVFQKELNYEAKRLGITVDDAELAEGIHRMLPDSYSGGTFVGMPRYVDEVRTRFDMSVGEFEDLVRQGLLEEKFRHLVTDGVSSSPAELQEEFLRRNEKVKLEYALIKPQDVEATVSPSEADLSADYQRNVGRYAIPERRVVRYALLDISQLREHMQISDAELRAIYQQNIAQYQVPSRVHVEHILFKTIGKTDAEVAEIQKKAEDALKQAKKKGADFEALARQNSEDALTKDKGGDLGWIIQGQTTPEFEKAAFGLPKGAVSDLVRTPYGFHIIKVLDRENARTKPFEEVRDSIRTPLLLHKVDQEASDAADKIATAVRKSNRSSLDDLASQFHLTLGETQPVGAGDPILELGNSKEVKDAIFELRPGELSMPIHTDRGYVVLSVKEIQPAHQGTFAEVRDRVLADWKKEKAADLARSKAAELAKRLQAGQGIQDAAKGLGLVVKTSDALTRSERIPDTGSSKPLLDAFSMKAGQSSPPLAADSTNWVVFRVMDRLEPNPDDFAKQSKELQETVLERKRELAFEAFRAGLEARLRQEGKLKLRPDLMTSNFGKMGGSL